MSRILPSTLLQQQSFNPEWIISDDRIPTGIVISCQFTTTSTAPITLSVLSIQQGDLTIVFSQGNNICASMTAQQGGIYPMAVRGNVLSATIEIGVIPTTDITLNFVDAIVNDSYISVVAPHETRQNKVVIIQDGITTEHEMSSDVELILDDRLNTQYDEGTRNLTISMSDEAYMDFTQLGNDIIIPEVEISTVNGVRAKDGVIVVNIYNDGALVPVLQRAPNWVELDNSDNITFCPDFIDTLDSYIAPSTHIGYFPLDDAYNGDSRDTSRLNNFRYGGFGVGSSVTLTSVDNNIDSEEAK